MCVSQNKQIITEPTGVSNAFNKYYINVSENILNKRKYTGHG